MTPFILGIIPARSGSKGVAGKNLKLLGGKPLIVHTIEAVQNCTRLSDCLVTTDGVEIADVARKAGAAVPFLRPAELASDEMPTIDTIIHAVNWYEKKHGTRADIIVLLQPTAPLRTGVDIDEAINCFLKSGAQSLISCYDAVHVHPEIMYTMSDTSLKPLLCNETEPVRRQDFKPVYVRNGAIYIAERNLVMESRRMYDDSPAAFVMPREHSINIDEHIDFKIAECLLNPEGYDEDKDSQ